VQLDENALIKQYIADCYNNYYTSICRYCRVRLGEYSDHTEDCAQESFLVLQKKLSNGEKIDQPRAFLYRTADNFIKRIIERYSKEKQRTVNLDNVQDIASKPLISDDFDYESLANLLISSLSQAEQELYSMKYIEQKSLKDISIILNIAPTATAKRVSRLRTHIKDLIYENNLFADEVTL